MTIYQEAHEKIDTFPEETVYLFVQLMDQMKKTSHEQKKLSGKSRFLNSAGKIDIDGDAILQLREASKL